MAALMGGTLAFQGMGRLEDPEFTIKDAQVFTPYPGATASEVEEEVTDRIELAAQQLGQLKEVESQSLRGMSIVTVRIKDKYDKNGLPQVWDELRRKIGDAQRQLPPGAGPSVVNDDFGDVWGIFVAVYGDEYSMAELREVGKLLRRELLLVKDVAKVQFWGELEEVVYVEPQPERMSQLGIPPDSLLSALRDKNIVTDSGRVHVGSEYISVDTTGTFASVEDIEELLIRGSAEEQIYLKDIADVRRGYEDAPNQVLTYDGHRALGFGISTTPGGNVVTMGEAVGRRTREILDQVPLGIEFGVVSLQSQAVTQAIDGFVVSLVEAVVIVIAVLVIFMGLRSSLVIGFILVLTIMASFLILKPWGVALERISLGALIIALGMLVDNAIVVVDGILVRVQEGQDAETAATEVVAQTSMPLLGATAVAIMAFASIGTSQDATGEFCRSLFQVVFVSLGLSWVTAVTTTPVLGAMFLNTPPKPGSADAGDGAFLRGYKAVLAGCIRFRWVTVAIVVGLFGLSMYGFRFVDKSFFPDSTRSQILVDMWLPQGTHIDDTMVEAAKLEEYLRSQDGVTHMTTVGGAGAMRFLLTYAPEKPNSAYAQFLVDIDSLEVVDPLIEKVEAQAPAIVPAALVYGRRFIMGPGDGGKIQARFGGPDADKLRELADATEAILAADGGAKSIRTDWRQPTKNIRAVLDEEAANAAGITSQDVAGTILRSFDGMRAGVYREGDDLLPIVVRAPEERRSDVATIGDLQVWSPVAGKAIPIRQVVERFETDFENQILARLNRTRTITVHADPVAGPSSRVLERIRPAVEALELPPGYSLAWWGEYKKSSDGQKGITASLPMFLALMVLTVVALFNNLRQPAIIWLCVPLALIGVTAGLLVTAQPFGFMALLGFLSLSGMLIKNAIVLIDEINVQLATGKEAYAAVVDSAASRLRPVAMAASTTALGMIPLLADAFFVAMAVTIIAGLVFATVITMVLVPVLYSIFYRVSAP